MGSAIEARAVLIGHVLTDEARSGARVRREAEPQLVAAVASRKPAASKDFPVILGPDDDMAMLRYLDISRTEIADLSPMAGQDRMIDLVDLETPICDLSPSSRWQDLGRLNFDDARVDARGRHLASAGP